MSFGMSTADRAPVRYFGGKWRIAPWIISHLPAHQCYVEPCCGGASVFMRKTPARLEVIADISGEVVNWWTMLRTRCDELIEAIALTPYAHAEFELAHRPAADDIERARLFFVRSVQGVGGTRGHHDERGSPRRTGWRRSLPHSERRPAYAQEWNADNLLQALYDASARLRAVAIEKDDWCSVVERYAHAETLVYLDPPYVRSERSPGKEYAVEWSDKDHRQALDILGSFEGMAVVSGYRCELYDEALGGWTRYDRQAFSNGGIGGNKTLKTESIWLSPRAMAGARQSDLFS